MLASNGGQIVNTGIPNNMTEKTSFFLTEQNFIWIYSQQNTKTSKLTNS